MTKKSCPFWRGACREHKCELYVNVIGLHPQTGHPVDQWGCSFKHMPMLLVENSMINRQTGAAVESFRNENVHANNVAVTALQGLVKMAELPPADPKLIEG